MELIYRPPSHLLLTAGNADFVFPLVRGGRWMVVDYLAIKEAGEEAEQQLPQLYEFDVLVVAIADDILPPDYLFDVLLQQTVFKRLVVLSVNRSVYADWMRTWCHERSRTGFLVQIAQAQVHPLAAGLAVHAIESYMVAPEIPAYAAVTISC